MIAHLEIGIRKGERMVKVGLPLGYFFCRSLSTLVALLHAPHQVEKNSINCTGERERNNGREEIFISDQSSMKCRKRAEIFKGIEIGSNETDQGKK